MDFDRKLDLALAELKAGRIWRSSYYPPWIRVLHCLGLKVRLPHYNRFRTNTILMGSLFGVLWGSAMHFAGGASLLRILMPHTTPVTLLVIVSLPAGALFGIAMATYYRASAAWNRLQSWDELGENRQHRPHTFVEAGGRPSGGC